MNTLWINSRNISTPQFMSLHFTINFVLHNVFHHPCCGPAEQVTRNERWAISLLLPPLLAFFVLLLCKPSLIDINVEKLHHESCFTLHLLRTIIISKQKQKQKHPPAQPTTRAINYHMAARVLIIMGAAASVYHISSSIVL